MKPSFVPGLELSRLLYEEAVRPLLSQGFPGLRYSAALMGSGSEVLGYDTFRSADHDWGPRLQLFLHDRDLEQFGQPIRTMLTERLPKDVLGWSTHFGPEDAVIRRMEPADGPVRHRIEVVSIAGWFDSVLGFDPRDGITTFDWLATPGQRLAEVVGGDVFQDGLAELAPVREQLRWYPPQLWMFLMACQWQRIAEEEAFPGRCAEVGDEIGGRVVTARLVRDLMRLASLMEQRYAPYSKWLGTAFAGLQSFEHLGPALRGAVEAPTWPEREAHLCSVYRGLAAQHNALGVTVPLDTSTRDYHDRPYQVIDGGRFATALRSHITDAETAALPPIGSVDQFVDSTAVLTDPRRARAATRATLAALGRPKD
jgi:hypothetical protein